MSRKDFNTDGEYRIQLFKELIEIVGELGWQVSIPKGPEDEEVPGMIIGTPEYTTKVLEAVDGKLNRTRTRR